MVRLFFIVVLLLALGVSCTSAPNFDSQLDSIVRPYQFSTLQWESSALWQEARQVVSRSAETGGGTNQVVDYFASVQQVVSLEGQIDAIKNGGGTGDITSLQARLDGLQRQTLSAKASVERTIRTQVRETLNAQGIFNPVDSYLPLRITFPPINFDLQRPPHLLVVSPRDRIRKLREVTLQPDLSLQQSAAIEDGVDGLGVSSLVVPLGGFAGTYPAFVTNQSGLRFAVETVAHEWLHQYLAFKPLGFAYLLDLTDLSRNDEVATINETVASMFGREVASLVLARYYGQAGGDRRGTSPRDSEFNVAMRATRQAVDQYLVRGEIEEAESFMEQQRQYLAARGYYIRKLNQAYFAFYGRYADSPASISPIGSQLARLRNQEASLKSFLEAVSIITSRQELAAVQ